MFKKFHYVLFSVSILPVLAIMPAMADTRIILSGVEESYEDGFSLTGVTTASNGGAMQVNAGSDVYSNITFLGASSFTNNTSSAVGTDQNTGMGGAIFVNNPVGQNAVTFEGAATFSGNSAGRSGGGLYNEGIVIFNDTADFTHNTAVSGGGAVVTHSGATTIFNGAATFTYNGVEVDDDNQLVATSGGAGAIDNSGITVFKGTASFDYNGATGGGGTILNHGQMSFEQGLSVTHSIGTALGGGIRSTSEGNASGVIAVLSVIRGDINISYNTGKEGGGIFNDSILLFGAYQDGEDIVQSAVNNISFIGNKALTSSAGALKINNSYSVGKLYANQIVFDSNSSGGNYGGAIFNAGTLDIIGAVNTFSNNVTYATQSDTENKKYYQYGGGAIQNRGNTDTANLVIGNANSINTFDSNISYQHGGAIYARAVDGVGQNSEIEINGATTFVSNKAVYNGGAISNYTLENVVGDLAVGGLAEVTFNGNVSFQNNIAGGDGGAIYNNGNMTFNGDVTFSGNKSGATFTFDEDTNVITGYTGGVANDIYNNGTITFGGDVTLDGGILGSGTIVLANGKVLNIGNACITQGAIQMNGGRIVAAIDSPDYEGGIINVGEFSGDGTIALTLGDVGTYTIFGNSTFGGTVFEGDITFESPIYNLAWNDDNTVVTAERKTAEQIATDSRVSDESANTVLNLMDSSSAALNDLGMAVQEQLALQNVATVEDATKAIHPETASVVQSVSTSVQNAIANLAAGRMAGLMGRSGGAMPARNGVWVEGMYNKSKQNDAFNGYTRGIVAGVDTQIARGLMLGAGYSYAHSDISAIARNTEIDSNTIFIYGQYKPTAWYMNAMANYTMSDYSEKSDVLGVAISSDFDVDALGAAVMTGYDFAGGITPELGLRYMHISADEYKNSLGIKSKLGDADYLTAVLGTKYAFDYRVSRGFTLRPELRYAVKYDLISDKSVAVITMPGVNSYVLDGSRLSRIGAEFGVGMVMKYNGFSLALNYDIEVREDYTSQTGRVRARMLF